jgi:hypothetical protein
VRILSIIEHGPHEPLREAIRASRSRALRADGTGEGLRPVDWLRFLSGSALASPEIESDVAVSRRLATLDGDVGLPDVPQWISQRQGRVVFLRADAGEGKTTYLGLMSAALRDSTIVLTWIPGADLTMDNVLNVTETVRSLSTEPLPAVVLTELRPTLDESTAESVLSTLREHESRADDTVFVIAGRPAAVDFLAHRIGGTEICTLAPVNAAEAAALCDRIQRAHDEVSKTLTAEQITERCPNLVTFLALPPDGRTAYFSSVPHQPLIIGFLKAIYGQDFVQRLVGEYRELAATADQRAYLHVCLATMAGLDLPERILRALAPAADFDARSKHDPWVRTERDDHVARHAVIAQTVLEGCKDYAALEQCFEGWVELTRRRSDTVPLLFHVVAGVAHSKPLAIRDKRITERIRRRLMLVLGDDVTLQERLTAESGASPARLFSWARLLSAVVPATPTEDCVPLLTAVVGLYKAALDLASDRILAEQIEYHRDRGLRDLAVAAGVPESIEDLEERVTRWRDFLGRQWAGSQFYADLFDTARQLALGLTVNRPVDRDSEPVCFAYLTSVFALVYLQSTGSQTYLVGRIDAGGELISRYLRYALPTRYMDVLKQAWELARRLRSSARIGAIYARAVLESPNQGNCKDESRIDTAVAVLREVLDINPNDSEAIYLLASLSLKRTDLIPFVRERLDGNTNDGSKSRWVRATLHSAAALIEKDPDARRRHLEQAVEAYAQLRWGSQHWDLVGKRWKDNCAELRRLGCEPGACGEVLKREQSKRKDIKG